MGGVLRQGLRALAIYFTDVVLWLSVAGLVEVLLVIGAGVLCILTAGFIFEGMKRSPVVLVLGSIVALSGTFLMFREVRAYVWPTEEMAPAPGPQAREQPPQQAPPTSSLPPLMKPADGPPQIGQPERPLSDGGSAEKPNCGALPSSGFCNAVASCFWSGMFQRCVNRLGTPSQPAARATVSPPSSPCGVHTKLLCLGQASCYWSSVTGQCETLRFRGLLGLDAIQPQPSLVANCLEIRSASVCMTSNGCTWSSSLCRFETSSPSPPSP